MAHGLVGSGQQVAVLVGTWDKGKLLFASHVGSGFDERSLAQMKARLEPLKRSTCPLCITGRVIRRQRSGEDSRPPWGDA
jgi:ATP-dependent DNA ligase